MFSFDILVVKGHYKRKMTNNLFLQGKVPNLM